MLVVCFPAISFADIYFCQSKQGAFVTPETFRGGDDPDEQVSFVVDTSRGIKAVEGSDEYSGTCDIRPIAVNCFAQDGNKATMLNIWPETLEFDFAVFSSESAGFAVFAGTCTKA